MQRHELRLIGLTGPMSSGKTTVAEMLAARHVVNSGGWTMLHDLGVPREVAAVDPAGLELGLADPMKEFMLGLGVDASVLWGPSSLREQPFGSSTIREALQTLGTEWGRSIDSELWLTTMRTRLDQILDWYYTPIQPVEGGFHASWTRRPQLSRLVISDVRFENEAQRIRDLGGEIWHITRGARRLTGHGSHASEQGIQILDRDVIIHNDRGFDGLRQDVLASLG